MLERNIDPACFINWTCSLYGLQGTGDIVLKTNWSKMGWARVEFCCIHCSAPWVIKCNWSFPIYVSKLSKYSLPEDKEEFSKRERSSGNLSPSCFCYLKESLFMSIYCYACCPIKSFYYSFNRFDFLFPLMTLFHQKGVGWGCNLNWLVCFETWAIKCTCILGRKTLRLLLFCFSIEDLHMQQKED